MLQVLGRLHPVLVHFPIALLLAALAAEFLRPRKGGPSEAGFYCLVLGTLGALCAALSGWSYAEHDPPGLPALLFRHRWSGIGTAASAGVTLLSAWRWKRSAAANLALPTRVGLVLTAVLVGAAGHLGGEMVYGEGFALEPLLGERPDRHSSPVLPAPPTGAGAIVEAPATEALAPEATPAPAPVDYLAEIQPILERRCYECHGDRKRPKGHLKLSDLASVFAREPVEAVIVPGDPEASPLYRRIVLPPDDEDVMPPDDAPIPEGEIERIRRWIAEGARWSEPAGVVPRPAPDSGAEPRNARPAPEATPSPRLDEAQRAARDTALERLRSRGAHARRISLEDDEVEVDLGVAAPRVADEDLALLEGLEPCLVELSLARTAVTAAGMARLASFRDLRRLRLEHTQIGDAALVPLCELPQLASLDLFDTQVGAGAFASLAAMPALARLYAGRTLLDDAVLDELARTRPGLVIERGSPRTDPLPEER